MRKALLMVGIPVSVLGLGLAGLMAVRMASKAPVDDFARELEKADAAGIQLAQSQASKQFALSEIAPEAKPAPKTVTKRATSGTKAVRSNAPTVKAAPEAVPADVVEDSPDVSWIADASIGSHTEASAPSMPEPSPATSPAPAQDQGTILRGGSGSGAGRTSAGTGMGTVIGVIFGSVIRGAGVDGDNCDPRHGRPTNTTVQRPVYGTPSGMGGIRSGGWGGATAVINGGTRTAARPRG